MTITNNSPINTTGGTLYINGSDFESKLFFTDSGSTQYYILLRGDTVITNGILNGYNNGINYDYRFDFGNYIKIENQINPTFQYFDEVGSVKFSGNNSCILSLCIDNIDLLTANKTAGNLSTATNGVVSLASGKTINNIVADCKFTYTFSDRIDDTLIMLPTNMIGDYNNYFPVTIYGGTLYYNFYSGPGSILSTTPAMTKENGYDYTVYLLRVPEDTDWIGLEGYDNNNHQIIGESILTSCYGYTNYYFWNPIGMFDVINCKGNDNIIETITKNRIQVGNKQIFTDISITKQIKQNSGFGLTQEQVYGLIETPNVIKIEESADEINPSAIISNTSGWTTTGDWTYSNNVWYATDSNYTYLMSPVINTVDHGFTYHIRFKAGVAVPGSYNILIQDYDAVETILLDNVGGGINEFTFTCGVEVVHFKIMFYGETSVSGDISISDITLWKGNSALEDGTKNPYENINLVSGSSLHLSGTTYGMGNIPVNLIANNTYTFSATGHISEDSYNSNEYMKVLINNNTWDWAATIYIYSGIDTTKSVTFTAPDTGTYNIAAYPSITGATGNVFINTVKVELGTVATPWTESIDQYIPINKEYSIDTSTFEGYNGTKLSQKNIELIFTDPKIYKRKTNNTISFFD